MIVGLAGSFGAGKGTVVNHLLNQGFKHYSASAFITEEIVLRGMPVNRDSMIMVANELRAKFGPTFIVDSLYDRAKKSGDRVVIESLRAVAEVKRIQELGGVVIGVDAEPELRYKRSVARNSVKDHVSFEKWQEQEKIESNQEDETKQNIFGALALVDKLIINNSSIIELNKQVDEFLDKYK